MNITHTHIQAYTHICIVLVSGVGDMITHFSVDTKLPSYFLIYLNNEGWVFNAVQFNHSVVTDSLQPHEQQHARPPVQHQLPEFTQTQVHWVGDAIQPSHSLGPFSSRLQSFPASGCFPMSQFFASGGQRIGVSASASVLPKNIQDWFPLGWISFD